MVILINFVLILALLISSILFSGVWFKPDVIILGFFLLYNYKILYKYFLKNKYLTLVGIIFFICSIVANIIYMDTSFSLLSIIKLLYSVTKPLLSILLLICLINIELDNVYFEKLKKYFLVIIFIIIVYGFLNYIFEFNLNYSGIYNYNEAKGRIQSFLYNPNNYGAFLLTSLFSIVWFFQDRQKSLFKVMGLVSIFLIPISIFLTYGRALFVGLFLFSLFLLIIFIFRKKMFDIIIIVGLFSFIVIPFLPDSYYMFYSTLSAIENVSNIEIVDKADKVIQWGDKVIDKIANKKTFNNNDSSNNNFSRTTKDDILEWNKNKSSSVQTRILFKEIGCEIYSEHKFLGIGELNYRPEVQKKFDAKNIDYIKAGLPHNGFLYFVSSYGLIGSLLYLIIIILSFYDALKSYGNKIKFNFGVAFVFATYIYVNINEVMIIGNGYIFFVYLLIWMHIKNGAIYSPDLTKNKIE